MKHRHFFAIIWLMSLTFNINAQNTEPSDSLIRELQEVVVKAKQPAIKLVGSSLVSTIAGSSLRNAGNALAIKLTATDIFNTRNNDWSMDTYGIMMNKYQSYDRRGITLSVQYQFQPKKSKYKGKAASEAEMNRL